MTDEALTALLRENPERGMTELVQQYSGYVYIIVKNKLLGVGVHEDIEEAVSDVFAMFYRWMQTHDTAGASLRALLAVMAKRHAINRYYKLTRQPLCDSFEELLHEPQDPAAKPDEHVLLMQAVQALGEPDSEIVLRRFYFGQPSKEIGAALGLKPNTVDQRLSRALKKLRGALGEEQEV